MCNLKKIFVLGALIFTTLFCVAQQCHKDSIGATKKTTPAALKKTTPVKKDKADAEPESFSIIHLLTLKFM